MMSTTQDLMTRAHQGAQGTRRARTDRRTRGRLRELCEEVLASYRLAQGEDLVSEEDRHIAEQVLRSVAPLAR